MKSTRRSHRYRANDCEYKSWRFTELKSGKPVDLVRSETWRFYAETIQVWDSPETRGTGERLQHFSHTEFQKPMRGIPTKSHRVKQGAADEEAGHNALQFGRRSSFNRALMPLLSEQNQVMTRTIVEVESFGERELNRLLPSAPDRRHAHQRARH